MLPCTAPPHHRTIAPVRRCDGAAGGAGGRGGGAGDPAGKSITWGVKMPMLRAARHAAGSCTTKPSWKTASEEPSGKTVFFVPSGKHMILDPSLAWHSTCPDGKR